MQRYREDTWFSAPLMVADDRGQFVKYEDVEPLITALKAAWFAIDPDTHPDQNRMVRAAIDAAEGKSNG